MGDCVGLAFTAGRPAAQVGAAPCRLHSSRLRRPRGNRVAGGQAGEQVAQAGLGLAVLARLGARRRGAAARAARKSGAAKPRQRSRPRGFSAGPAADTSTAIAPTKPIAVAGTPKLSKQPTDKEVRSLAVAINAALERHGASMVAGLRKNGWWASESAVLNPRWSDAMRQEVEALWEQGRFQKSQSVRGTEYYDKDHVFATEIDGSAYETAPLLVHYTVDTVRNLAGRIRDNFPELQLSDKFVGNKLNFCVGQGASFDAHLDVGVAERPFNRKLTLLFYLNDWRPELGGEIALLGEGASEEQCALDTGRAAAGLPVRLAPTAGRWVAFWSDRMLHKVEASEAPRGLLDYRASYTLWLCTEDGDDSGGVAPPSIGNADGFERVPAFARL